METARLGSLAAAIAEAHAHCLVEGREAVEAGEASRACGEVMSCDPNNIARGCAVAIVCQRCVQCLAHCTCPPERMRASDPDSAVKSLRTKAMRRKLRVRRRDGGDDY